MLPLLIVIGMQLLASSNAQPLQPNMLHVLQPSSSVTSLHRIPQVAEPQMQAHNGQATAPVGELSAAGMNQTEITMPPGSLQWLDFLMSINRNAAAAIKQRLPTCGSHDREIFVGCRHDADGCYVFFDAGCTPGDLRTQPGKRPIASVTSEDIAAAARQRLRSLVGPLESSVLTPPGTRALLRNRGLAHELNDYFVDAILAHLCPDRVRALEWQPGMSPTAIQFLPALLAMIERAAQATVGNAQVFVASAIGSAAAEQRLGALRRLPRCEQYWGPK